MPKRYPKEFHQDAVHVALTRSHNVSLAQGCGEEDLFNAPLFLQRGHKGH